MAFVHDYYRSLKTNCFYSTITIKLYLFWGECWKIINEIRKGGFTETYIVKNDLTDFLPDMKVLERMACSFKEQNAVKKTQLQLASKLRWDLFSKYWDWLQSKGFLQNNEDKFVLTPKGNEMITLFQNFYELIHIDQLPLAKTQ